MSDLQTNIEIEDVLASIRRLVSDGEPSVSATTRDSVKPKQADASRPANDVPVSAPPATANNPAPPEKFVLSPELLVQPAEDASITVSEVEAPEHADVSVTLAAAPLVLRPAEIVPIDGVQSENAAPSEAVSDVPPPLDMWHLAQDGQNTHVEPEQHIAEPSEMESSARRRSSAARTRLLSTIEELEAAVTDTDDFEPDGSESTPVMDWTQTSTNEAIFGARAASSKGEAGTASDAAPDPVILKAVEDAQVVEPKLSEDRIDNIADAIVDTESESFAARVDADLSEYLNADTVMDEAALREMVADIVRQELQGALGERITRNVRKLVRREIYRALASEEFS